MSNAAIAKHSHVAEGIVRDHVSAVLSKLDLADRAALAGPYRPFEYGHLVLLFWIPYLPYYLRRTRRATRLLLLTLLLTLYFLGDLLRWLIDVAR
jgi:hypothetical protein